MTSFVSVSFARINGNSCISVMWSAVPDAPVLIKMFMLFVGNRAAALKALMTYGITQDKFCVSLI